MWVILHLSFTTSNYLERQNDPGDIPLFTKLVNTIHPRFFVKDDLPRSLRTAYPMKNYCEALPDYDLFPEWVSNWGYGNPQRNRNRLFMIGALRTEGWTFFPSEVDDLKTVEQFIGDLVSPSLGGNNPCDRESSGEENEHEVLKPFIAIQRVQLPPGKGQPTSRKRALHGVRRRPS